MNLLYLCNLYGAQNLSCSKTSCYKFPFYGYMPMLVMLDKTRVKSPWKALKLCLTQEIEVHKFSWKHIFLQNVIVRYFLSTKVSLKSCGSKWPFYSSYVLREVDPNKFDAIKHPFDSQRYILTFQFSSW